MTNLAPIGLSAYSRLDHLKQNIAALKLNIGASKSHLYIFSDAPKAGDNKKVEKVREYLRKIDGFKKIELVERKYNNRVRNNRDGIETLLDEYGKVIFLEEDIVTAPGFLEFMNGALKYYENDKKIFSITGYTPPIEIDIYCDDDIFIMPRFSAWGFGIWKDRYESIRYFDEKDLNLILENRRFKKYISRNLGEDVLLMLQSEAEKKIDALDVKAMYQQILNNTYTIYPKRSLVKNTGFDGSGIHCRSTTRFDTKLWQKAKFSFTNNIRINKKILKSNSSFRKLDKKIKYSIVKRNFVDIAKDYKIYRFYKILKKYI
jgi:hypothetical protein